MIVPVVEMRMKKRNQSASQRVRRMRLVVLGVVTALAGQSEVLCSGRPAPTFGLDVIERMLLGSAKLGTDAVLAVSKRAPPNQTLELDGNTPLSHAVRA